MRRQQLIQLLQFILAWVLLWLFVVFVMEKSFVDFVLRYWLYLLFISFCYFYYYSIEYEPDKKYELIRNLILYGNIYLFFHVFFRPLLNISHQLFILLWLIILWLWWTTKLTTRWKYLLQILWWIFSFFILISGMFYFYPDEPDIQWFLKNRSNEIRTFWVNDVVEKRDAYIQITNLNGSEDFGVNQGFSKKLSENLKISYPSLKKDRDEKLVIMTPHWDLVWIFPQSEVQLEFEWDKLKTISKLNWKIWFLSWIFESDLEVLWYEEILTKDQQDWLNSAQDVYKYELMYYLKDQISESNIGRANNTVMYNIDGKIIWFLAKLFPVTFSKNLRNYNEFQKYFNRADEWVDLGRYSVKYWSWDSIGSIWWNMKDNINIWKSNTYGRFREPEKR